MRKKLTIAILILIGVIVSLSISLSCTRQIYSLTKNDGMEVIENSYHVPIINLDFFAEKRKNILVDYLTQSSEWHVFPFYKTLIAEKRSTSRNCDPVEQVSPLSYAPNGIPSLAGKLFNLYPKDFTIPETNIGIRNKADENKDTTLKINKYYEKNRSKYPNPVLVDVFLEVTSKNKNLSLRFFGACKTNTCPNLDEFMKSVGKKLEKLASVTGVDKQFTDVSILPPDSMIISPKPTFSIEEIEKEYFAISGHVNMGKKGLIFSKVLNKKTGNVISSPEMESTSVESVGWSTDSNKKFKFCLGTSPYSPYENPTKFPAEFQIWFRPLDGSSDLMLYKETRSIMGRWQ